MSVISFLLPKTNEKACGVTPSHPNPDCPDGYNLPHHSIGPTLSLYGLVPAKGPLAGWIDTKQKMKRWPKNSVAANKHQNN